MVEKKEKQLLKDPNIQPTEELIAQGLGKASTVFVKFIEDLNQYGITLMDWRYYNDGKAWLSKGEYKWTTARGTNKVKPIFWLSIWEGFFKVSFFFGYEVKEELLNLPISQDTKSLVKNAKSKGNTARFLPIIIDVTNEMQLNDIYVISEFRKIRVK